VPQYERSGWRRAEVRTRIGAEQPTIAGIGRITGTSQPGTSGGYSIFDAPIVIATQRTWL
ncbi:MAG TPA: hypothetical protein VHN80_24975, partial [Kineosporiaceae bacterium]|nr:hypothetical protein [Kineosporiaceae bacterium]